MSKIAIKHIKLAVRAFLEDGASEQGSYRDVITEVLHLAHKRFTKLDLALLRHWICTLGWDNFEEELQQAELDNVKKIPDSALPLHLDLMGTLQFDDSKKLLETRLKNMRKHVSKSNR